MFVPSTLPQTPFSGSNTQVSHVPDRLLVYPVTSPDDHSVGNTGTAGTFHSGPWTNHTASIVSPHVLHVCLPQLKRYSPSLQLKVNSDHVTTTLQPLAKLYHSALIYNPSISVTNSVAQSVAQVIVCIHGMMYSCGPKSMSYPVPFGAIVPEQVAYVTVLLTTNSSLIPHVPSMRHVVHSVTLFQVDDQKNSCP